MPCSIIDESDKTIIWSAFLIVDNLWAITIVVLSLAISFNANFFKEILVANKECTSAVLEVSNEGLAKVNFKIDDYDSTYYIVAMQDVD